MPDLSIVVVHHRGLEILQRCLASLASQTLANLEVVLVENGCSEPLDEAQAPGLRIVRLPRNLGFAAGANAGIAACHAPLIALLNDDAAADRGWAAELAKAARLYPWAGFFASRMLQANDAGRIDSAGDLLTRFGEGANRGRGRPDGAEFDTDLEVFGACAGAAMFRRELLDDVGLFDDRFFHSCEDVDLALRARLRGWRCVYVSAARVSHLGAATRGAGSSDSVFHQSRNVELAFWANLPRAVLVRVLPWHAARVVWGLAAKAREGRLLPYLLGKLSAVRHMPRLLRERRHRLATARAVPDDLWRMVDSHWHLERASRVLRRMLGVPPAETGSRV